MEIMVVVAMMMIVVVAFARFYAWLLGFFVVVRIYKQCQCANPYIAM